MRFSLFFIDRPIFATVLSILITLIGAVAYFSLPVTQYPEIAPPTIQVTATYPGASAETVADTVATPIEQEVNGVEGMEYMVSQSTGDGRMTLSVTFKLGTDIDQAQVLVQNRVSAAEPRLPEEVRRLGINTVKSSPDLMMVVHMLSPDGSRDELYISNYARTQVVDRLARIEGVGNATVFGERAYSMRIWLDPELVAARGLTAGEVVSALRANNVQVASGTLGALPVPAQGAFELQIETQGRLLAPEQFEQVVVAETDDGLIRIRDIGRVELGAQDYTINGYLGPDTALPIGIFQRPGSNALDTAAQIIAAMDEMAEGFPPGISHEVVYNPTEFISASIDAVYATIIEAVLLVVLVIVLFLQSLRASIIPIIAIPVSLVGTFFVMAAFGYSLNNLTLFGLVLAIGIVVDDAIIVVENMERFLEDGQSPRDAARNTMMEVSGALIAQGLVLLAVFVPTAFLEGITGQFFRQFALTIATATLISVFLSLTLSPALASLIMRKKTSGGGTSAIGRLWSVITWPFAKFGQGFNWVFDRAANAYGTAVRTMLRVTAVMLLVYGGLLALTYERFNAAPEGFIPAQDQGYLITVVQLPPGSSLSRTDAISRQASDIILQHPAVRDTVAIVGLDGATFTNAPNAAAIFVPMKDFAWRAAEGWHADRVLGELQGQLYGAINAANIFLLQPPPVSGIGTGGGWKLYIQDRRGRGLPALEEAAFGMMIQGNQVEGLTQVFTLFNTKTPKIYADIDLVKAELIGISPEQINEALEVYLGSSFVNDFNFLGRTYRVTAQADGEFRDTLEDVSRLRTRSKSGAMTPIGAVATFENITGPYRVARYNLYPAAALQGATDGQTSTGEAIERMEALADRILPSGFDYEWTELALQEKQAGNTAILVFLLAVIFVFLVLAAQYESWLLPLSVILIVPMCLLAGITGVILRGMDNNILTQIGFVVLVGLASKNAILIVEFARQGEQQGRNRVEAAIHAARLRLRPILMTSFAFILGVLPLVIATGPGAEMRQALGTAVFSGMIGVTVFGLVFTPVFYVVCRWVGSFWERAVGAKEA